jgi:hypothetical protein
MDSIGCNSTTHAPFIIAAHTASARDRISVSVDAVTAAVGSPAATPHRHHGCQTPRHASLKQSPCTNTPSMN